MRAITFYSTYKKICRAINFGRRVNFGCGRVVSAEPHGGVTMREIDDFPVTAMPLWLARQPAHVRDELRARNAPAHTVSLRSIGDIPCFCPTESIELTNSRPTTRQALPAANRAAGPSNSRRAIREATRRRHTEQLTRRNARLHSVVIRAKNSGDAGVSVRRCHDRPRNRPDSREPVGTDSP